MNVFQKQLLLNKNKTMAQLQRETPEKDRIIFMEGKWYRISDVELPETEIKISIEEFERTVVWKR